MKRSESASKSFLCEKDLTRIWSNANDIRELLSPSAWTTEELETIQMRFTKVLSVLILFDCTACLVEFRVMFYDTLNSEHPRTDAKLPFKLENLSFLETSQAHLFYEKQFVVIPVDIRSTQSKHDDIIEADRRLPFLSQEPGTGWGGYGSVDEVEIAPGYLEDERGKVYRDVRVAM